MSSVRTKITKKVVDNLRPGQVVSDTELQGFSVRCHGSQRVYSVRGRCKGARIRWTIGAHGPFTPVSARVEATRVLGLMAAGIDPRQGAVSGKRLNDAAEPFLEKKSKLRSPGTLREYRSHLRDHLLPQFGAMLLDDITSEMLERLHRALRERPVLGNRVIATLSSLYTFAGATALCRPDYNPTRGIERYVEAKKERYLDKAEVARLGRALFQLSAAGQHSVFALAAIKLLLLTGCRRDEIRTAQWSFVDFDRALLTLPRTKTGRRVVHLCPTAIAVLKELSTVPNPTKNPFVIRGSRTNRPHANLQDVWQVVRLKAGLQDVRLHDLRHSVASFAAANGASLIQIGGLLGHRSTAATMRYVHLADSNKRQTSDDVSKIITESLEHAD